MLPFRSPIISIGSKRKGSSSGVWTLASIPGLIRWIDVGGGDGLYQDEGGTTPAGADDPVGYVTDLSSYGNAFTQATADSRPLYKTGIQNGLGALLFDGTDDFLSGNGQQLSGDHSVFVAAYRTAETTAYGTFISNGTNQFYLYSRHAVVKLQEFSYNGTGQRGDDPSTACSPRLFCQIVNGTEAKFYIDGVLKDTDAVTSAAHYISKIGIRETDSAYPFPGYFYSLVVYNNAISDANRLLVENYINTRWALYS